MLARLSLIYCLAVGLSQPLCAQLAPISRLSRYVKQYQADKNSLQRKYLIKEFPEALPRGKKEESLKT